MEFKHISVLLDKSIKELNINPNGIYIDGTLGGGGHSSLICEKLKGGTLVGIDRDLTAISAASERLSKYGCEKKIIHDNFFNIKNILSNLQIDKVDGAILDLGVSSPQLDTKERGFSYNMDARLDMRMNQEDKLDAYEVVNKYSFEDLRRILSAYGEEKNASNIAKNIVRAREEKPITTTVELCEIIKKSFPPNKRFADKHPAKRSFQAIRIEVNRELDGLCAAIKDFVDVLKPSGRLCVITFHSLEDRIVKQTFSKLSEGCTCPKDFPICVCGNKPKIKLVSKKPFVADESELADNLRAHSAKLRVIEKI